MKLEAQGVGVVLTKSHPSRGAWIEIIIPMQNSGAFGSHPSRGAWIEIDIALDSKKANWPVAPLAGCVD